MDHGFSFPQTYFDRYSIQSWPQFLDDFVLHWPTDREFTYVDFIRDNAPGPSPDWPGPGLRIGQANEFRLCERWTSSARSVFQFDVQGSVAKSTHAGVPPSKAVLVEVYPSIFRNRYARDGRSVDEQDAYATARWLSEAAARGSLKSYFQPPLTESERQMANKEGWILGIS